jgi:hypothetical protein
MNIGPDNKNGKPTIKIKVIKKLYDIQVPGVFWLLTINTTLVNEVRLLNMVH